MEEEQLLEGERIITESTGKVVTLTTHRVRYHASNWGQAHIVSIMLNKISSIEVHYKGRWIVLAISVLLILAGVAIGLSNEREAAIGLRAVIAGGVSLLVYLFTRRHVITIASDGGAAVNFETKGMPTEKVVEFINKVEGAKYKFLLK